MTYVPKRVGGYCEKCGTKLPVPAWRYCLLHDTKGIKITKEPYVKIKDPVIPAQPITKRSYGKHVPDIVLKPKKYFKRPFGSYLGYSIKIPFDKLINAKELITDNEKWEIIGWK